MIKKLIPFFLFIFSVQVFAQVISSSRWSDLFSYNNVIAIREDNGKLIAATENGIFFYTPATGEITKLSKVNGLHEVKITAFDYNPETKVGLIGYKSGALDVITPDGITYVVDIPIATGYTGSKTINHISITGNLAAVSSNYGVSVFRLDKKEFGDSSFFNNGGVYEAARESVIRDNTVYTVTATGIRKHTMDVTFPIYSTWTVLSPNNYSQIAVGGTIGYASANAVFIEKNNAFSAIPYGFSNVQDVFISSQNVVVADIQKIVVFDLNGNLVKSYDTGENVNTGYFSQSKVYAGTQLSGMKNEAGELLKPDGPYNNQSYKLNVVGNQIVISTGGRDAYDTPLYNYLGYYHFNGTKWIYPDFFKSFPGPLNVLDVAINPAKPSEVFFVNWTPIDGQKGIYRMENDEFKKVYASTDGWSNRTHGLGFDENNQLFVTESQSVSGKSGFYLYNAASDNFTLVDVVASGSTQRPFFKNGIMFIACPFINGGGMIMYDYNQTPSNLGDDRFKILRKGNNLAADGTVSGAIDKNDDLWIGTRNGLRVISNPKSAIGEDSPQTSPIIIEENGIGEELFRDGSILQIEVDGGNQKWVSIDGGGVFYLSSNGEKTFNHFTKENSPLPTNEVTGITVDNKTGKVYFVTLDGVVVYQGDVLDTNQNFGDVLVYPNPVVYANYKGNVRIRGLAQKTNIRITDAAGNLVHQAVARGGYYEWNLNNQRGARVASGIYFVLMTNEDATDTATAKIAVVN